MATKEQLRTMVTAQPFRPYMIRMAGGRTFTVRHPENASCDPNGRSLVIQDADGMHLVEMLLVEVIEEAQSSPDEPRKGKRAKK
jgi:hypothetical protein